MKLLLTALLLLCATGAWAEGYHLELDESSFVNIEATIAIQAPDRKCLISYLGKMFPIAIGISGEYIEYKSLMDFPMGDVYIGHGKWFIRYDNNYGYMPLWVKK